MKAFVSWSGGKDCMFALNKFLQNPKNEICALVNILHHDGGTLGHHFKPDLLQRQAICMNLSIIQKTAAFHNYEIILKQIIAELKEEGLDCGVFGDIYLEEHRVWIEKVCAEMDIKAVFPLWGQPTKFLLKEFIELNFESIVVAIDLHKLDRSWLGRKLDHEFYNKILQLPEIDPCGENGEFHTFVYNGPHFQKQVYFEIGEAINLNDDQLFIKLN